MDKRKLSELSKDTLISKILELESVLNEFQQSSKELERALEEELQDLETKNATLRRDLTKLQEQFTQEKLKNIKLNSEINQIQETNHNKVKDLEHEVKNLQQKLVKIEIINDSMESNDRILCNKYEISQEFSNELLEKIAILEDEFDREKRINIERQLHITNYQNQIRELQSQIKSQQQPSDEEESPGNVSIVSIKEMLRSSPPPGKYIEGKMKKSRSLRKLRSLTLDIDRALNRALNDPIPVRAASLSGIRSDGLNKSIGIRSSQRFSDLPSIKGSPISTRSVSLDSNPKSTKPRLF